MGETLLMGCCKSFDCDSVSSLAAIPARGGSKGVIRKCLRQVGGISLLERAIKSCLAAKSVSRLIVSTDDPEFAETARQAGAEVPFLRPAELATDGASVTDAILHLLKILKEKEGFQPEFLLLLQPTAPFVQASDIDGAFKTMLSTGADAATSVCESEVKPDWLRRQDSDGWLRPIVPLDAPQHRPRQEMPRSFRLNGAVYWTRTASLLSTGSFLPQRCAPYEMPRERSIDIDEEIDLEIANFLEGRKR